MEIQKEILEPIPRRLVASVIGLGLVVAVLALGATRAEANTYCANMVDTTGCTMNHPAPNSLQAALDDAAGNPGPDKVLVGPGTQVTADAGAFSYTATDLASGGNSVEILGSGTGQTKLVNSDIGALFESRYVLDLRGYAGSSVSGLTIDLAGNQPDAVDYGLYIGTGNVADGIDVTGPNADNVNGIASNGATLKNVDVNLGFAGGNNTAVLGNAGSTSISDSSLKTDIGVRQNDPTGTATIVRSRLTALYGVNTSGGTFDIRNSLIKLAPLVTSAAGVYLSDNNNTGTTTMKATLDGVTIVGDGTATGTKDIGVQTGQNNKTVILNVSNTVLTGAEKTFNLVSHGTGTTITNNVNYSAFANSKVTTITGGGGTSTPFMGTGNINLTTDPLFTNEALGDYTPQAASPLVDTGDPAAPAAGTTDIFGHRRDCNSTPGGVFRRDIGAFEYNDCINPDTTITNGPGAQTTILSPSFTVTSSKSPSTFSCSFDGSTPVACGATFSAPDKGLGAHHLTVAATDQYGNVDPTPATYDYTVFEHSIPPPIDKTAPKVTILGKVPKKTSKKSVKIRFKSNEGGSAFTCKVGKSKAKKCKSPFKVKLKKGKNKVAIVATDKAGNHSKPERVVIKRRK